MAALRDPHVTEILVLSFALVLFVGALFSLAVAAGLAFRTRDTLAIFARMNRWVSTRLLLKPVEIPRAVGNQVPVDSRRRWIAALVFALGGAYAAVVLAFSIDVAKVVWVVGVYGPLADVARILVDTIRWFLVAGCAAAVFLGVVLMFFPRAWKALEARANAWVSTRQLVSGGDSMHLALDRWAERYPRHASLVIALLALIPGAAGAILLFGRL